MYVCMHACVCVYINIQGYEAVYVCMYVCRCVYIYIYIPGYEAQNTIELFLVSGVYGFRCPYSSDGTGKWLVNVSLQCTFRGE
jgi:hypothetical protein